MLFCRRNALELGGRWGTVPPRRGTTAWRQCPCLLGWRRLMRRTASSSCQFGCWAGPWDGVEQCGARNRRTNAPIHRFDLGFIAVGEEQGWCMPPVRPNASMSFKFEFLNLVSTLGLIYINNDFWCYDEIYLISAT